jgi:hypothetical protein
MKAAPCKPAASDYKIITGKAIKKFFQGVSEKFA